MQTMHWIDWTILGVFITFVIFTVSYATKYMKSVSDFLAGSRVAGRYLITIADGMAGLGAISIVAWWEMTYQVGYGASWWGGLGAPIGLILTLSGWVIYRFRQTRALTLAQFFEVRYSRKFRVFAGVVAWAAGVINYGIFPSVAARFFVYYCGIPPVNVMLGGLEISLSYCLAMIVILGLSLWVTLAGGQLAIMITDCMQGIVCLCIATIIAVYCLHTFTWDQIGVAFQNAPNPDTASMINPFKTGSMQDFNIWYFLIGAFILIYGTMAWQGQQGFNAAPKTPHEARMARVLGTWRAGVLWLIIAFLAVCAYTVMNHPAFADIADAANLALGRIDNPTIQNQMKVPIILSHMLPVGLVGLLCAIVFSTAITNDDAYLHSWGSIFIQDVVMPFRKKAFTPAEHIRWLRWSIVFVAVFAFFFSLFFRQTQYIYMFFALTGAIFLGGAGSVIIGGLYWRWGTTTAAWLSMIAGSVLSVGSIVVHQFPIHSQTLLIQAPAGVQQVLVNGKPASTNTTPGLWEYKLDIAKKEVWGNAELTFKTADAQMTAPAQYCFDGRTDIRLPAVPDALQLRAATNRAITLAWTDRATNETGFIVERSPNGRKFTEKWMVPADTLSFTDSTVEPTQTYFYRVQATNAFGVSLATRVLEVKTPPLLPAAPKALQAAVIANNQVNLTWTSADAAVSGFVVERSPDSATYTTSAVLAASARAFTDRDVRKDGIYFYRVKARNAVGDSPYAPKQRARTFDLPLRAPETLTATMTATGCITLAWSAVADTGYNVERSLNGINFEPVATLGATPSFTDASVAHFVTYYYRVTATNRLGSSYPSPVASVATVKPLTIAYTVTPPDGTVLVPARSFWTLLFTRVRATNGQVLGFYAMMISILTYAGISLMQRKEFDMDRLLHRGKYAIASDQAIGSETVITRWRSMFGVSKEFTRGDKILYFGTTIWSLFWMGVFFTLLIINLVTVRSDHFWLKYFEYRFYVDVTIGFITTIWFAIGGYRDVRDVLHTLSTMVRNHADDGRVVHHHNAGE